MKNHVSIFCFDLTFMKNTSKWSFYDAIFERKAFTINWIKNLLNKFPIDFEYSDVPISGCSKNTFSSHLHCHHTTWVSVKNSQKVARFCVKTSYRSISRSSYNWMPKLISRKIWGMKKNLNFSHSQCRNSLSHFFLESNGFTKEITKY